MYSEVSQYLDAGMSNAEVSALLNTLTVNPLGCADLENYFSEQGLAERNPTTGVWEGLLINVILENGPLSPGLGRVFSHLNKPRSESFYTHKAEFGPDMAELLGGMVAMLVISAVQHDDIYALAGGLRYSSTELDVADAVAANQAALDAMASVESINAKAERYDVLYNEHISPLHAGDFNDAAWVAALQAMSNGWSV
tara:strand:- start:182 stop:772 length:591 start_codon:yes stop_codon:yes gene_type:complete